MSPNYVLNSLIAQVSTFNLLWAISCANVVVEAFPSRAVVALERSIVVIVRLCGFLVHLHRPRMAACYLTAKTNVSAKRFEMRKKTKLTVNHIYQIIQSTSEAAWGNTASLMLSTWGKIMILIQNKDLLFCDFLFPVYRWDRNQRAPKPLGKTVHPVM